VTQKFHFTIFRIEVTRASRGLSAIAELLVGTNVAKKVGNQNVLYFPTSALPRETGNPEIASFHLKMHVFTKKYKA